MRVGGGGANNPLNPPPTVSASVHVIIMNPLDEGEAYCLLEYKLFIGTKF